MDGDSDKVNKKPGVEASASVSQSSSTQTDDDDSEFAEHFEILGKCLSSVKNSISMAEEIKAIRQAAPNCEKILNEDKTSIEINGRKFTLPRYHRLHFNLLENSLHVMKVSAAIAHKVLADTAERLDCANKSFDDAQAFVEAKRKLLHKVECNNLYQPQPASTLRAAREAVSTARADLTDKQESLKRAEKAFQEAVIVVKDVKKMMSDAEENNQELRGQYALSAEKMAHKADDDREKGPD